jgi:hypothetical protein
MPALTYTVTDPVTGHVFKSRRKTRPYGAVIVDGVEGPRVEAWAGRPDLLDSYHRRAINGTRFSAPQASARVAVATESHPAIRTRLPRTLAGLSSHPWVESVSDERGMGAGIWVYLKPGYVSHDCCHTIHESTVRECCRAFRFVWHDPDDYLLEEQATRKYLADLADLATPAPAEAAPAEAAPAEAAPAPAAGRSLNPLAQILLTRLQAAEGQWLMVEAAPIVDTLKGLGWLQRSDVRGVIGPEGIPAVECRITAAGLAALTGEAAPAPSIAGAVLEASAALNAEGEAATSRALATLGRIRAGLEAIAEADAAILAAEAAPAPSIADGAPAPRPTLPGEATPPPALSHGEAAPTLPELCPATPGTPTRAEAVRDVERRDGGGVAVICSGSDREAFRLPDTVSLCGAAAALEAGGWILSPALEGLARRWRDISGGQDPSPEAVAIAEAAAPQGRRFEVFHRTWWRAEGVPGVGQSHHIGWAQTETRARYMCRRWNATHAPGPLSDRAEYTAA